MTTDTELREAFHSRLDGPLSDVTINPSLLSDVRRRHRRERRVVALGAPLAVIGLVAGTVLGVHAVHSGSSDNSKLPIATRPHVPTILGHPFRLPAGWTRQPDGPPFPAAKNRAHGLVQEWEASSENGLEEIDLMAQTRPLAITPGTKVIDENHQRHLTIDGYTTVIGSSNTAGKFPVEAGVTLTNGDYLDITAQGMTVPRLEQFIAMALAH